MVSDSIECICCKISLSDRRLKCPMCNDDNTSFAELLTTLKNKRIFQKDEQIFWRIKILMSVQIQMYGFYAEWICFILTKNYK